MNSFYGWAEIRLSAKEEVDLGKVQSFLLELKKRIEYQISNMDSFLKIELHEVGFFPSITIVGSFNHRYDDIINFFRWLSEKAPGSFGLLYFQDTEDHNRGGDYENSFRVWRLVRGKVDEHPDPFLSPCIPVIEDPMT